MILLRTRLAHIIRDFRFACPRWPLYTPEGRPAPETLVRHRIVPLQRPSAQPVVTCGRLEALCSRHFSDTAPHVGHFFANRTALPVPRVSLPAPAAPRSAATCRRTAAGLDVLRQQEPVVPGMLHEPAPGLHQPLLETRERPAFDPRRQDQSAPEVAQGVGQDAQLQAHLVCPEPMARQPRPVGACLPSLIHCSAVPRVL